MSAGKKRAKEKAIKQKSKRPTKAITKVEQPKIDNTEDHKYVKVSCDNPQKFKEISERIQSREIQWSHFVHENGTGVHYYLIKI